MKDYSFCNNCGKYGHLFHQCKNPVTSMGIIVFNGDKETGFQYLMIQRKDSLGYVDFMRGKYPLFNKRYLLNIINEMTINEKNNLLNSEFDKLWEDLWGDSIGIQYRGEEKISRNKFNCLKMGINLSNESYNLESLIQLSNAGWGSPEWGFPKGRRNYQEKDLICALREFEEETGYGKNSIKIIQNLLPLEEIFTGSNYKSYKHKYYLAHMDCNTTPINNFQRSEVSDIRWIKYDDCFNIIRPYNLEKRDVLKRVNYLLNNYTFY